MRIHLFLLVVLGLSRVSFSQTNIFEASKTGDIERILELISAQKDTINSIDENGFSPLILAAYRNQSTCVELLLSKGANVNYCSPEGTALHAVCYKGNVEMARLLLKNNQSINALSSRGTSCLVYAVQSGKIELVQLLLDKGADKNIADEYSRLPLDYAKQAKNQQLIELLSN